MPPVLRLKVNVKAHNFHKIDSISIQAYFGREIENSTNASQTKPILSHEL